MNTNIHNKPTNYQNKQQQPQQQQQQQQQLDWLNENALIDIIETASQLILQIYLGTNLAFDITTKSDNSPLTLADRRSNDYICQQLQLLYPDIPIISEENQLADYSIRSQYTYAWLIDPLDGTKEFISRNGEFTVNIGLIYDHSPVAGFVSIPAKGLTYWSIQGRGAFCRDISSREDIDLQERRRVNITMRKNTPLRVLASRSHTNQETEAYIKELGEPIELLNVGSSIKILWIAENYADIYPRLVGTMEWDTCAAHAILNEMGGNIAIYEDHKVTDKKLVYNKESLLNPYFICSCPTLLHFSHK